MALPFLRVTRSGRYAAPRESNYIPAPLKAIASKPAQRAYLSAAFFLFIASVLGAVSVVSYWSFYYNFVPQVSFEREIHLQFGNGHPFGTALLGSEPAASQPYDVSVVLNLPRTPSNLAAGNFMLDLALMAPSDGASGASGTTHTRKLAESRRPGILTYASPMVDTASRFARMPFYVSNWRREAEVLRTPMMERIEFAKGKKNIPSSLKLEIQSDVRMQIYTAVVRFDARFTGLRWIMYNWRTLSFLVFGFTFWVASMTVTVAVWMALSASSESEPMPGMGRIRDSSNSIKTEDEGEASLTPIPSEGSPGRRQIALPASGTRNEEEEIKREEEIEESTMIEPLIKEQGEGYAEGPPGASTQSRFTPSAEGAQRRRTPFSE